MKDNQDCHAKWERKVPILRLDHVQLAMPAGGEDAARAFYQGVLGIIEVPKPAEMANRGGCWFEDEGVKIHLGVDPDFRPARKAQGGRDLLSAMPMAATAVKPLGVSAGHWRLWACVEHL